jgi:hypothetical protein
MSEQTEAAERLMNEATIYEWGHRTDPSLPLFERDILTVATAVLEAAARPDLQAEVERLRKLAGQHESVASVAMAEAERLRTDFTEVLRSVEQALLQSPLVKPYAREREALAIVQAALK